MKSLSFSPSTIWLKLRVSCPISSALLTGRGAPPEFLELADLVTEMREVKHYYAKGVDARVGVER